MADFVPSAGSFTFSFREGARGQVEVEASHLPLRAPKYMCDAKVRQCFAGRDAGQPPRSDRRAISGGDARAAAR